MGPRASTTSPTDIDRALEQGWSGLRRREWRQARDAFQRVLDAEPVSPIAWEGLAIASLCLDDAVRSRSANERAYREYLDRHDFRGAARVAIQLAVYHDAYRGESAIASGWFERARSLLDTVPAAAEHAWLAFWKAHVDIHVHGEVAKGEPSLEDAIRLNEVCNIGGDLALMTRGLRGLMAISEGAVDEGLRRLDEATTEVLAGDLPAPQIVGWTYCYVLDACENVRDFDRASQWIAHALESMRALGVVHQSGACRSHYVAILTWRGDYAATEHEIETMRRELGDVIPTYAAQCDIRLGEIRRRQGRLDEAAALLDPLAAQPLAMLSLAALALDRDEPQIAVDLVERYLRRVSDGDRVRRLHGLELLVRAQLQGDRIEAARTALQECEQVVARSGTTLMRAMVCALRAEAEAAEHHFDDARRGFEDAIDGFDLARAPYEATAARLRLGEVLVALRRTAPARKTFEAALAGANRLGARRLAQRAAAGLRWDGPGPPAAARQVEPDPESGVRGSSGVEGRWPGNVLTGREIEVLALVAQGISNQEIGERLFISSFTVKRHIANILTKLDLPTRAAAAAYAIREGLAR
jgi:ATP/maltotriose-dependent transcriptional regulator MalT